MLTRTHLVVLQGLKDEPKCGTDLTVLPRGTVFAALKELVDMGLIEEAAVLRQGGRGRPRVLFTLTEKGRRALPLAMKVASLNEELEQLLKS